MGKYTKKGDSFGRKQRLRSIAFTAFAAVWLAGTAGTQSILDVQQLTPGQVRALDKDARKAYEEGIYALDHVDHVGAVKKLAKAASLAPDSVPLQFLTAQVAMARAQRTRGSDSESHYRIAEAALERVGQRKNLTPAEEKRLEAQTSRLEQQRRSQALRAEQRSDSAATTRHYLRRSATRTAPRKTEQRGIKVRVNAPARSYRSRPAGSSASRSGRFRFEQGRGYGMMPGHPWGGGGYGMVPGGGYGMMPGRGYGMMPGGAWGGSQGSIRAGVVGGSRFGGMRGSSFGSRGMGGFGGRGTRGGFGGR